MRFFVLVGLMICSFAGFGQSEFQRIKSLELPAKVEAAAIDRVGELYLITNTNRLIKYDVNGDVQASDDLDSYPEILDPRDGSHVFLYWKKTQQYELRLPDLKSIAVSQKIDSSFAVTPFLVCPSGDHDILILDSADWSLKKISTASNTVLYETIIFNDEVNPGSLVYMREYQNFFFILERGVGIHVFNRMGKLLRTIENESATWFNFLGEEVYYPSNGKLRFFNLFTTEERELSLPQSFSFALISDERLFVVKDRSLTIYSVTN